MSEIKDMVMPLLQKMQTEAAEFWRETKSVLGDHSARLNELNEKFDNLSGYITYQMGMTARNGVDIEDVRKQLKDLSTRVSALEAGH
jgi:hypothetical protein